MAPKAMARPFILTALLCLSVAPAVFAQNVERQHQRACDGGEVRSCTVLGLIYETGAGGGDPDVERAIELYRQACDFGLPSGCTRLALAQQTPPAGPRQEGFARVGHIADAETGAPIVDAVVELPRLSLRLMADAAGRVDFGALPRGRHTVLAGKFGYERVEGELPVPWDSDFLILLEPMEPTVDDLTGAIYGRIVEDGTDRELAYVDVTIAADPPIQIVTGPDGRFSISELQPGTVEVTLSLIGYAPRTTTVFIEAGTTLELRASLSAQAIELEPIEVIVGSGYLQRNGFYHRSRHSIGTQFTRSELDRIDPMNVSDVLRRAPGVDLRETRGGGFVPITSRSISPGQGECRLRPYLDGMAMFEWNIDDVLPVDLEAIEIYHGPSVPIEYARLVDPDGHYPCGVVLLWTTRGRR